MEKANKNNFLECETLEQANNVSLADYTFIGLSDSRGYVFKIREAKR